MLRRIWALTVKEFLVIWRDRRSRVVIIVPPLLQLLVFGYAASFDVNHIRTAVLNEDGGIPAREFIARFEGAPTFDIVAHLSHDAQIRDVIDAKDVSLVIHLGQTFSRDLAIGRPAPAQIILDGRQSNTALIILGYVNAIVSEFNTRWLADRGKSGPPATLVVRAWFNPNLESRWFIVPGIVALLTMVVTVVLTSLSVAREREVGTFEQLLVGPFRPAEILIGKSVPPLLIGLAEGSVIVLVAVFWFGVPFRGGLIPLFVGLLLYVLAVIGIGLMVSSIARTQQQAILGAFLFIVPAVILSGFATPIDNMPWAIQRLTLANPMRHFLIIVRGSFLEGLPVDLFTAHLWPMALIAVATLMGAGWLFRRMD